MVNKSSRERFLGQGTGGAMHVCQLLGLKDSYLMAPAEISYIGHGRWVPPIGCQIQTERRFAKARRHRSTRRRTVFPTRRTVIFGSMTESTTGHGQNRSHDNLALEVTCQATGGIEVRSCNTKLMDDGLTRFAIYPILVGLALIGPLPYGFCPK